MRLDAGSFEIVRRALQDACTNADQLDPVTRCLDNIRLIDVSQLGPLPAVVGNVIAYAETHDLVKELIGCAQKEFDTNQLVAALDIDALQEAKTTAAIVESGGGGETFKQRLNEALANLDDKGMALVAAKELRDLLTGASRSESETLYLALVGNLLTDRPSQVLEKLVPVVAASLRKLLAEPTEERPGLDLARARLRRIDLNGLDLHEADIAFADLGHASLEKANLWRSRGYAVDVTEARMSGANLEEARWHSCVGREASFGDCRMVSVVLKEADLAKAGFERSQLQGAHFEGADLTGASFEEANLSDAYFVGATIDEVAARSLSRARTGTRPISTQPRAR